MPSSPITHVRIAPPEKRYLSRLARERGMTLSEALRAGAWLLLEAGDPPEYRVGRPKKGERQR